ncbi:MAG: NAD-dependent epimerase/dehydratase family protein [Chloroflexi bacterium]|nr:MAG: NAD-dependent epimerase/dehydratase family protein [Chloroflexota bacterium]
MKVLVTGGAGFIGSHLVDALVERGDEVLVVDDLSTGDQRNLNPRARFHRLDIRESAAADLVRGERPDVISHHAAQMSVSRSVAEPVFDAEVNVLGSLNLARAAVDAGSRIVFASTGGALYGDAAVLPTAETAPAWPVSPYGISKLAFEHYLYGFRRQYGLNYAALRYANVYGPRQNPHGEAGVVAIFCEGLLGKRLFKIHGEGTDTRDYVYVDDVVRANLLALDSEVCDHFNVGTGRQADTNTIYRLVAERMGRPTEVEHGPPRPGDLRASALDASLLERTLGWKPEVSLEEGIAQTVDWFLAQERSQAGTNL